MQAHYSYQLPLWGLTARHLPNQAKYARTRGDIHNLWHRPAILSHGPIFVKVVATRSKFGNSVN
jgi:hypothetical protein